MTVSPSAPWRVAFRTDASVQIGTGHVMRCLTLADALRQAGAQCQFICREHDGHVLGLIAQRGYAVVGLPLTPHRARSDDPAHAAWLGSDWEEDAHATHQILSATPVDWLIVDHYALDARWETALKTVCKRLMVIDDLADRAHDCDLLLDQNLGRLAQNYAPWLNFEATALTGPQYALLRPEFAQWREYSVLRRTTAPFRSLLITMGGVDKDNASGHVLNALRRSRLPADVRITVVMGTKAPWLSAVQKQAADMPWSTQVVVGVNTMAQLMADSDLAIGAAGGTAWERCCVGLPSVVLIQAENQRLGAHALQAAQAATVIEGLSQIERDIPQFVNACVDDPLFLKIQTQQALAVTDGGGCARVVQEMQS